jgi:hypothetical protein
MGLGLVVGECAPVAREMNVVLPEVLAIQLSLGSHRRLVETDRCTDTSLVCQAQGAGVAQRVIPR